MRLFISFIIPVTHQFRKGHKYYHPYLGAGFA